MLFTAIKSWLEGLSRVRFILYCSLLNIALTLISTPPMYLNLPKGEYSETNKRKNHVDVFTQQIENPFDKTIFYDITPERQEAKRSFRFTVPLMAHVLGLGIDKIPYLEFASGILLIILTVVIIESILKNNLNTLIWSLSFASIPFFKLAFFDTNLYMDSFSYLFVSAIFILNSPFLILLFSTLACFSDERAYLSIIAVILFFASKYYFDRNEKDRNVAIYLACSIIGCLAMRFLLGMYFGLKTPTDSTSAVGLEILKLNFFDHPFSLFTGFELVWLLFPLSLYSIYRNNYMYAIVLFGTYLSFSLSAWIVLDVTRSVCYIFPLLFLSLYIINKHKIVLIRKSGIFISIGCFIIPTMFYVSSCFVNSMDFPFIKYIINKLL